MTVISMNISQGVYSMGNRGAFENRSVIMGAKYIVLMLLIILSSLLGATASASNARSNEVLDANASESLHDFKIEQEWLTMHDGVRLSVTYYLPIPRSPSETFPVILEMNPYRKDDQSYIGDYDYYTFFARHGFAGARVDIRGTGSSESVTISHEYSPIELSDCEEVIAQIARLPWCNGNVGMLGISWSANNAIMMARRGPPALKAIIVAHMCDDLFHDHAQYIDGIKQVNEWEAYMEGDNIAPRSPEYRLDEDYFRDRFLAYPWFLTNLKHQHEDSFWMNESVRYHYENLTIPIFILGGLLDGYRDSVKRLLEGSPGVVRAEIGPYNHAFPDYGVPGPNYEWRYDALRWYDRWLNGAQNGIEDEPRFKVFVRAGHPPDPMMNTTPGKWRYEDWPINRTRWTAFYPSAEGLLSFQKGEPTTHDLPYQAGSGIEASGLRFWWGEPSQDVAASDEGALVYDSPEMNRSLEIIGYPEVALCTAADAPLANWIVRLEDVQPDGKVTLITGAGLSGAQRNSSANPDALVPGTFYNLSFKLHFTTWTFQPGHKIRLAITNAQFPAFWPTPYPMTMMLKLGVNETRLVLPVIPYEKRPVPVYQPPEAPKNAPDAKSLPGGGDPIYTLVSHNQETGIVSVEQKSEHYFTVLDRSYYRMDWRYYETNEADPANSRFLGISEGKVTMKERSVLHRTKIDMHSSVSDFHVIILRRIYENDHLMREKVFDEVIPRDFQ